MGTITITAESEGMNQDYPGCFTWDGIVCDKPTDILFSPERHMEIRLPEGKTVETKGGSLYMCGSYIYTRDDNVIKLDGGEIHRGGW